MTQLVRFDVKHEPTECPAAQPETLAPLIATLKDLPARLDQASHGRVKIDAQWYERNAHMFHYLCAVDGLTIALAEDALKQALDLPALTVQSYPTESGADALAALERKLSDPGR